MTAHTRPWRSSPVTPDSTDRLSPVLRRRPSLVNRMSTVNFWRCIMRRVLPRRDRRERMGAAAKAAENRLPKELGVETSVPTLISEDAEGSRVKPMASSAPPPFNEADDTVGSSGAAAAPAPVSCRLEVCTPVEDGSLPSIGAYMPVPSSSTMPKALPCRRGIIWMEGIEYRAAARLLRSRCCLRQAARFVRQIARSLHTHATAQHGERTPTQGLRCVWQLH